MRFLSTEQRSTHDKVFVSTFGHGILDHKIEGNTAIYSVQETTIITVPDYHNIQ